MEWLAAVRLSVFLIFIMSAIGYPNATVTTIVATTVDLPPVSTVSVESESSAIPFESGANAFGMTSASLYASNQQVGAASARSAAESRSYTPDCLAQRRS